MLRSLRSQIFASERASAADSASSDLDGAGLLEAIVCETHRFSLHAAVIASGVNALRVKGRLRNPLSLKSFLLNDSAMIGELLRRHEEAGLDAEATSRVLQFFGELSGARATMERFFADADRLGVEPAANAHHVSLFATWTKLCASAGRAVAALDADVRSRLPDYYASNSALLRNLLTKAAAGEQPCLDESGNPSLPDLPQRRHASRRSLLQQAILRHRGKSSPVIAKDISSTGLGLERVPELKAQELVQIELTCGRRLMGLVMWIRGSSAGIKLGKPLPPNDPLLIG
jgi:hypothetical protein